MNGFFPASLVAGGPKAQSGGLVPKCGACRLCKSCDSPKMAPKKAGRKNVLIVLDCPTSSEDASRTPLNGQSGDLLKKTLEAYGLCSGDYAIAYAVACHTTAPDTAHVEYCNPALHKIIKEQSPTVIMPMGPLAINAVLRMAWASSVGPTSRFVGYVIPAQKFNAWIIPSVSALEVTKRDDYDKAMYTRQMKKAVRDAARACKEKPYKEGLVPDHARAVEVILDPAVAATRIRAMMGKCRRACAWDYEANALKPEWGRSRLYSAAICRDGVETIAFLIHGEAKAALKEFLKSDIPKIAANMKYEYRWSLRRLGIKVRNWLLDTMLAAHVLDNRTGTKSIKFIAFVMLGQPLWNEHIEPFLESDDGNHINRIDQIDTHQLLVYNGMDALLEYLVADRQYKKIFGTEIPKYVREEQA